MKHQFQNVEVLLPHDGAEIIIGIRPMHVQKIYSGNKSYELRKSTPKRIPRIIYFYTTEGGQEITGHAVVKSVRKGPVDQLWKVVGTNGTSKKRFFAYYSGIGIGCAYELEDAVRYKKPISRADVAELGEDLSVPQNFIYTEKYPKLRHLLRGRRFEEAIFSSKSRFRFRLLADVNRSKFSALVVEHISGSYAETGQAYAAKILEVFDSKKDHEGILTVGKYVIEVLRGNELVGFIVATEKMAGNLKTGPVIILQEYRNSKFGQEIRSCFAGVVRRAGFRKIYATAPATNKSAVFYLLGSGYKIEAHLQRHYHHKHDEIVFGSFLGVRSAQEAEFVRNFEVISKFSRVTKVSPREVGFLQRNFSISYSPIEYEWAAEQVEVAVSRSRKSQFKPRLMFAASGVAMGALAFCILKRGGSVKIVLLSETKHHRSLLTFLNFVEGKLRGLRNFEVRRFYAHVPSSDADLQYVFRVHDYRVEGVLEGSYRSGMDYLALGKLIDR